MSARASSSVVGIAVLTLLAVLLAGVVGAAVIDAAAGPPNPPRVTFEASADATRDRITLTHRGGDPLVVESLRLEIRIDGQPLAEQPPIPFFAATGFESGPTGPFNVRYDGDWTAGETAGVRLASTNNPQLTQGARVTIRVYTTHYRLATVETRASVGS